MPRKRPEATFSLEEDLYRELEAYCQRFAVPPSTSAVVRQALKRFLEEEMETETTFPPKAWVAATRPVVERLAAQDVQVSTREIIRALKRTEEERTKVLVRKKR